LSSSATAAPPTLTYLYPAGAQCGTTATVTVGGTFERWPVRTWVDGKGLEVQPAKVKGQLTITVAADALPGTYWLRLYDDEGATALRPFLVGTLPEVLEQEPNDDAKKPQLIDGPSVIINGRLEKAGDVDCFALQLRKGQTLVASLQAHEVLGSPMDGLLQILSADGFVLEQNNDYHGLDPQIIFTVPKDGRYVVRTFAFPAMPDASIRFAGGENYVYRLTLTTNGFADHAFPLAVNRAQPGTVELVGWNIPESARTLKLDPMAAADHLTLSQPQVANTVAVRLEAHAVAVQTTPNDRAHPQAITLPVTISGCLERPGDIPVYQFEGKKGQKLFFEVEAQALGFSLVPVLRLTDLAGKTLAQAEGAAPGSDPTLAFAVPQDGKYLLEVRDLHGAAGPRHLYRLRALLAAPDFALTLAADRFTAAPGKALDVPVPVERRNGFDGEIEIVAEGLPEGVTAAPVKAAVGAKMVTLRLTTGSAPLATSFRIRGRAVGEDSLSRLAYASLTGLNASTVHMWLSVPQPTPAPPKGKN
jgi:hypothetical protein